MAISSSTTSVPYQYASNYTICFGADSDLYPTAPLKIEIFKNGEPFYIFENCNQSTCYDYTFNEPSSGTVVYTVTYTANYLEPLLSDTDTHSFTVAEFKPTFTLPVVSCAEKGQPFIFYPTDWFQNSDNTAFISPPPAADGAIEYKRYEFDMASSSYVYKHTDLIPLDGETGSVNGLMYAYQGGNWIPDVLTMVKFEVTVTNCNTSVIKNDVFPICGAWKLRRLSCGNYRFYNYKNSFVNYSIYDDMTAGASPYMSATVPPFTFIDIVLRVDNVYKITSDGVSQYIFNFCEIEACVLSLQKQILLDCTLCDSCKMDKVLYQKALRLISIYETWKKLLDKDWIYDMQYLSTDIDGELTRIYDAKELYAELKTFCSDCGSSPTKKCNC